MSISRRIAVLPPLGLEQAEVLDERIRAEVEHLPRADNLFKPLVGHAVCGAERLHTDRNGFVDPDGIGNLNLATVRQPGGDDILGDITRVIRGAAIHLGRVLSGERSAAVRSHTPVGIDDDLATGQTGIADGAADDEFAGGIHQEFRARRHKPGRSQEVAGDFRYLRVILLRRTLLRRLMRDDHR